MSQQEMYPEGQQHAQEEDAEIQAQPYYWSTTPRSGKTGDIPKSEHPSTFEESIPAYGYRAQNTPSIVDAEPNIRSTRADELGEEARMRQEAAHRQQQQQQEAFRRRFSPDGDAFEYGYRPYKNTAQWQQVPPWARPQSGNRRAFRWLLFIILAFVFAKPLLFVLTHLLTGVGILVGIAAFAILLPIILIFVLIAVFSIFALIALRSLGVPIRPGTIWRGWRSYRRRRRTWRR